MSTIFDFKIAGINSRELKGKSLLSFVSDYTVIDLETTGFDSYMDDIIEFGAIKYRNNIEVARYNTLINPGRLVDEFIIEHTGITNEMLESAPNIEIVIQEIKNFIDNDVLVAHNANFDVNFLYDAFDGLLRIPCDNDFIDTLRLSRRIFKDFENHKLSTLASKFGMPFEIEHRSIPDCLAANFCYQFIKKYALENNIDLKSISRKRANINYSKVLNTENTDFDEEHPLYNQCCVFTGTLEKMIRKDAMQIVLDCGGKIGGDVNKETNFLILGNNDYCSQIKDGKSNKLKKAEKLILEGKDLAIISENVFYEMISADQNK